MKLKVLVYLVVIAAINTFLNEHTPHYEFAAVGYCIAHSNYKWLLKLGVYGGYMQSTEGVRLLIQALTNHSNRNYTIESITCCYKEHTVCRDTAHGSSPSRPPTDRDTSSYIVGFASHYHSAYLSWYHHLDKLHTLEC